MSLTRDTRQLHPGLLVQRVSKKLRISLFARTTMETAARAGVILWSNGFAAKMGISLFARSALKTAARACTSFRAATAVAPIRTVKTTVIRKDEGSKEDSIHVVSYEKGQRREHGIEVDESKPDVFTTTPRCNGWA
jgi:hypothetical protein